jgi:hypothetical protein
LLIQNVLYIGVEPVSFRQHGSQGPAPLRLERLIYRLHIGVATQRWNWAAVPLPADAPITGSFSLYRAPDAFSEGGSFREGVRLDGRYARRCSARAIHAHHRCELQ